MLRKHGTSHPKPFGVISVGEMRNYSDPELLTETETKKFHTNCNANKQTETQCETTNLTTAFMPTDNKMRKAIVVFGLRFR